MFWKKDMLFCDINPTCFMISTEKEILKRRLKDHSGHETFAAEISREKLPNVIAGHSSKLIKKGVERRLQENKAVNIRLACRKLNGLVIHPGEVFSFWRTIGRVTRWKGYQAGRVLVKNELIPGTGGGSCNLGNTIHYMVLHSPLDVVEFHSHSDALAPDVGERVPFAAGTSVCYNYIDYRFKNNTEQDVQLLLWCDEEKLYGELRSERAFPWRYELFEEEHRFQKEGEKFYRVSKIYRNVIERESGEVLKKELVLDNHSEVMYNYDLIPRDQIRETEKEVDKAEEPAV